ncbi:hypothetical protein IEC338SC_3039 [Acinetobacter pittii]|uniref:Phage tail protein n=1 Tax=Acinetobacter pittii TaxID=48296 RepID=A0AB33BH38_ACIPI|nr:hypothetical protein [Acinetobacter pittii]AMX20154.1 hypothetical protein IEC338SC_3039 [Acinetobacter pittii]
MSTAIINREAQYSAFLLDGSGIASKVGLELAIRGKLLSDKADISGNSVAVTIASGQQGSVGYELNSSASNIADITDSNNTETLIVAVNIKAMGSGAFNYSFGTTNGVIDADAQKGNFGIHINGSVSSGNITIYPIPLYSNAGALKPYTATGVTTAITDAANSKTGLMYIVATLNRNTGVFDIAVKNKGLSISKTLTQAEIGPSVLAARTAPLSKHWLSNASVLGASSDAPVMMRYNRVLSPAEIEKQYQRDKTILASLGYSVGAWL